MKKVKKQTKPKQDSVLSINRKGFHHIAYRDWGNTSNPAVFCLHGLTRNSTDFNSIASELSTTHRIVCPDTAGRGKSDWLPTREDYNLPQYNLDVGMLAAKIDSKQFDIIGTSLGGLMGIVLASMQNSPVKKLVVNDIAPEIPYSALKRLSHYLGEDPLFNDLEEAEVYLRDKYAPFGPMNEADWKRLTKNSVRTVDNGYRLAYDPTISDNYRRYWLLMYFSVWKYWENLTCPVLVVRGKESDFLTEPLLSRMMRSLPHAELIEFEGVGHTPSLNAPEQIDPIVDWLRSK